MRAPYDFIVTGWRRCGTTMLVSLLNDHPALACDNDSFNYFYAGDRHFAFLADPQGVGRPPKQGALRRGLKVLHPFLVPDWNHAGIVRRARRYGSGAELPDFFAYSDLMQRFTEGLIAAEPLAVNIVRHALFVYVSEQIALQRREFKYKTAFEGRFAHVFDIDDFRRWFELKRQVEARTEFLRPPERTIDIFYDDLASPDRRQAVLDRVFAHLGVPSAAVQPATSKQLPIDLRDYVLNYDEMIAMLSSAGFGFLLPDRRQEKGAAEAAPE